MYTNQSPKQCYMKNEKEKNRHYNERIQQVDQGNFSPLVFPITGGMATECKTFFSRLADLLSEKRKIEQSMITCWLKTKINFAPLRSMLL